MHRSIATTGSDADSDTGQVVGRPAGTAAGRADRRLRVVLTVNAATSTTGGAVAAVAGGRVDSLLGTGSPGWVRLVGAGLVAFGLAVLVLAGGPRNRRSRLTPVVSALDATWVVATVATIAAGWFSTRGAWTMAALGAVVLDLAVAQLWFARRAAHARQH